MSEQYPANYNAFRRVLAKKIKKKWEELQHAYPRFQTREDVLQEMDQYAKELSVESGASLRTIKEIMSSNGIDVVKFKGVTHAE